jgi:hypothetical protein
MASGKTTSERRPRNGGGHHNERFALRCGDRHQTEAILSAGTFQPGDLIGASVGRALWSDGGPSKALQFFEVSDHMVKYLELSGFKSIQANQLNLPI